VLFLVAQLNTRFVCYVIWVSCFVYNLLRVVNWKIKVITIYQNFSLRLLHWLGNKMCKCLLVNKVLTRPCIRSQEFCKLWQGSGGSGVHMNACLRPSFLLLVTVISLSFHLFDRLISVFIVLFDALKKFLSWFCMFILWIFHLKRVVHAGIVLALVVHDSDQTYA